MSERLSFHVCVLVCVCERERGVCMYVCMYQTMDLCRCALVCVREEGCVCVSVCMCVCVHAFLCVWIHVFLYVHMYIFACASAYASLYTSNFVRAYLKESVCV